MDNGDQYFEKIIISKNLHNTTWDFGSLGTKIHSDATPMGRCRVYYIGEGGGSSPGCGESCESEVARGSS
jgi:hypothetical protein